MGTSAKYCAKRVFRPAHDIVCVNSLKEQIGLTKEIMVSPLPGKLRRIQH